MPFDRAAYYRAKRDAQRERARAYLGGVCVVCGATENLDFHHVDPATMTFRISTWLLLSWERLVPELDKCELRCKDHHIDEHRSTALCGTNARYSRGCRCDDCVAAHSEVMRAYYVDRAKPRPKALKPIAHGTRNGYQMERRRGLDPCDECKAANAAYTASLSARR